MTTDAPARLLYLLQVANASFPTGAFNHSYGFETWIDSGALDDAASFESACRDWLRYGARRTDGAAVAHAHRLAEAGDLDALVDLDHIVGALKLSRESREASFKTGRALLGAYRDIFGAQPLASFADAVREGRCEGHQAIVFGAAAAGAGDRHGRCGTGLPSRGALQPRQRRRPADPARPDREPADRPRRLAAAHGRGGGGLRDGAGRARQRHRRPRHRQHAARAPAHAALYVVSSAHAAHIVSPAHAV